MHTIFQPGLNPYTPVSFCILLCSIFRKYTLYQQQIEHFLNSFYLQQFVKDSLLHNSNEFHEIKLNVKKYALNCVS